MIVFIVSTAAYGPEDDDGRGGRSHRTRDGHHETDRRTDTPNQFGANGHGQSGFAGGHSGNGHDSKNNGIKTSGHRVHGHNDGHGIIVKFNLKNSL